MSAGHESCYHGGAFFDAIGDEFDDLTRREDVINADVLDAWFPPSPLVLDALREHLPWLVRTSPPTDCGGMARKIAAARGVGAECIQPGAGSSDLIFLAFSQWLSPESRVLILDPTYGEYNHVLENIIGCQVERFVLHRGEDYQPDLDQLKSHLQRDLDMVVLVNPNSPTGRHVPRAQLEEVLTHLPTNTIGFVDETYVEYVGSDQSLEKFADSRGNVVVCKSMSKVYALSGVRSAYLCANSRVLEPLRAHVPPWAVSLPAQVAAVFALAGEGYYADRWGETHELRGELVVGLEGLKAMEIVPSAANFVLCHLDSDGPTAQQVVEHCRESRLFLRDVSTMGQDLGRHALRIAVKDRGTNERIVQILGETLRTRS